MPNPEMIQPRAANKNTIDLPLFIALLREAGYRPAVLTDAQIQVRFNAKILAAASELFPGSVAGLTINHRQDVFFFSNRIPYGLSETLVHRGADEDIAEKEERDEPAS